MSQAASTELVPHQLQEDALASVAFARLALDEIASIGDAKDFSHKAAAAAEYFRRAKDTMHVARQMTEIRIWAERRAGQLIDQQRLKADHRGYVAEIGTASSVVSRWLRFALADEDLLRRVIDECEELTVMGVARRLTMRCRERVERGIYLNPDGRYIIRWRANGVSHQRLVGPNITTARNQLLIAQGKLARQTPKAKDFTDEELALADLYSRIRSALDAAMRADAVAEGERRSLLNDAHQALYKAEDAIGTALRKLD